jgi:hypothetical protein
MSSTLFCTGILLLFVLPASAKTAITFEETAVVARVTPGANTAWFAIVHDRDGYRPRIVNRAFLLEDGDGDGVVRFHVERAALPALWMVVDLTSGDHAIGNPQQDKLRRRQLPPAALRAPSSAGSAHVFRRMTSAVLWVARPGVGAWVSFVEDGSEQDADHSFDGNVTAAIEKMVPLGASPHAPGDLLRNDIVAIVDPYALDVFDTRVVK